MRCVVRMRLFSKPGSLLRANCLHGRLCLVRRSAPGAGSQGNVGHLCFVFLLFDRFVSPAAPRRVDRVDGWSSLDANVRFLTPPLFCSLSVECVCWKPNHPSQSVLGARRHITPDRDWLILKALKYCCPALPCPALIFALHWANPSWGTFLLNI